MVGGEEQVRGGERKGGERMIVLRRMQVVFFPFLSMREDIPLKECPLSDSMASTKRAYYRRKFKARLRGKGKSEL